MVYFICHMLHVIMLYVSIHICIVPKIPISTGCRGANIGPMPGQGEETTEQLLGAFGVLRSVFRV